MQLFTKNFGCKLNLAQMQEYNTIAGNIGYRVVSNTQIADIALINSCHVTNKSAEKIKKYIARLPVNIKTILITGCAPDELKNTVRRRIIYIPGNKVKDRLKLLFNSKTRNNRENNNSRQKTRAFVIIQEGCDTGCTYCIIPKYRGPSKSVPPLQIINKIKKLENIGYQEVVLTGTNLGQYSYRNYDLGLLIKDILEKTSVPRLRISSIDVTDINRDLITLYRHYHNRICPHFHLALQSGSDPILKKMNRPYTISQYTKKVELINRTLPNATITTDIIVGFPSETKEDFEQTCRAVNAIKFLKVHIFSYSEHKETASRLIGPKIDRITIKKRYNHLKKITSKIRNEVIAGHHGKIYPVIFEMAKKGYYKGYTPNYIPLHIKTDKFRGSTNAIVDVEVGEIRGDLVTGIVVNKIVNK